MKKLIGALLMISCGVATGAECTSPPAVVWTDTCGSMLWKTARETPIKVSVDWPEEAASATLTVNRGGRAVASVELADTSARTCSLAIPFPETEEAEAVLDMTLVFRDSSNVVLSDATRTASIGLVRGVEGRSFRLIPSGGAARQWSRVRKNAVAPVPDSAVSAALDGQPLAFSDVPGWLYLRDVSAQEHSLVLNIDDGDPLIVPLFGVGGMYLFFR